LTTKLSFRNSLPFIAIALLGIYLRLLFLNKNDLWYDEVWTLITAKESLIHINPPFYFIFIKLWIRIFGISEFALRLPSVLFSFGSLLITYLIGKELFGRRVSFYALTIIGLSPFHLWYAQEARHYSFALLLGLTSSYFLLLWLKKRNLKYVLLYALFSTLSIYTHYFCIFLVFSQILSALIFSNLNWRKSLLPLFPLLFFLPWISIFTSKIISFQKGFWIAKPTLKSLLITFENLILGYNGTETLYFLNNFLILILVIVFIFKIAQKKILIQELFYCLILSFLPIATAFVFSQYFNSVYLDRCFLFFTPYFYISLSYIISKIEYKIFRVSVLTMILALLILSDINYFSNKIYNKNNAQHHTGTYVKQPYKPLADFLRNNSVEKNYIIFTHLNAMAPLGYYLALPEERFFSFSLFALDPNINDTATQRPYQEVYKGIGFFVHKENLLNRLNDANKKIFFIGCDWARSGALDENSISIKLFLDKYFILKEQLNFDGIKVFIYEHRN